MRHTNRLTSAHIIVTFDKYVRSKVSELSTDSLEDLIRQNPNLEKDGLGEAIILWAAENGHLQVVKLLLEWKPPLERDASTRSKNKNGRTPISLAAENGHDKIVEELLNSDRNAIYVQDKDCRDAIWWAIKHRNDRVIQLVVEEEELDSNTLRKFVEEEDVKSVQRALEAYFEVDSADAEGVTPLCLALRKENCELIELLQEHHAGVRFIKKKHWQDM
jgi:ankyrin repeat protein